jgi:hypothetical protein
LLDVAAVGLVLCALLAVVIGQAMLANGQVRLAGIQQELQLEQASHRQQELDVSQRETPARIVAAASAQGLIHPAQVIELPYVPLSTPLATPKVAPAPPAAPPATSAVAGSTAAASGASTTSQSTPSQSTTSQSGSAPASTATTTP